MLHFFRFIENTRMLKITKEEFCETQLLSGEKGRTIEDGG